MERMTNEWLDVPDGESGNWKVQTFEIDEENAIRFNNKMAEDGTPERFVIPGTFKRLLVDGKTMMSTTPNEIDDHRRFIEVAMESESVLINGLGLGVALRYILQSDTLKRVVVVENSMDVIKLVSPSYLNDRRVTIVYCDAMDYEIPDGKVYDAVWHDIWLQISSDNLEEIDDLHDKYMSHCKWQGSWMHKMCMHMAHVENKEAFEFAQFLESLGGRIQITGSENHII